MALRDARASVTYSKPIMVATEMRPRVRFKSGWVIIRDIVDPRVRLTSIEKTVMPDRARAKVTRTQLE